MTIKQPCFAFLCDDFGVESLFDFCKKEVNNLKGAKIIIQPEYLPLFKNIKGLNLEHFPLSESKSWALVLGMLSFKELDGVVIITSADDFLKMNCHVQSIISMCKQMGIFCAIDDWGAYGALKITANYKERKAIEEQEEQFRRREFLAKEEKRKKEQYLHDNPIYWFDEEGIKKQTEKVGTLMKTVNSNNESEVKNTDCFVINDSKAPDSELSNKDGKEVSSTDNHKETKSVVQSKPISESTCANDVQIVLQTENDSSLPKVVNESGDDKKSVVTSKTTVVDGRRNLKERTGAIKKRALRGSQIRKSKK